MTLKPLGYTGHARDQLKERHITRQQVRWLLARGIREPIGEHLYEVRGYFGRDAVELVVREDAIRILIITVYWVE